MDIDTGCSSSVQEKSQQAERIFQPEEENNWTSKGNNCSGEKNCNDYMASHHKQ